VSGIVWLASYPKSGNTWLRIFLANYLSGQSSPVDINALDTSPLSDRRDLFDEALGVESSDLSAEEIDSLRAVAFQRLAAQSPSTLFFKVHDAWTLNARGEPLLPAGALSSAIYVARNPLDLAISAAAHAGSSVEDAIRRMEREDGGAFSDPRHLGVQMRQRYLSWSSHVVSWLDQESIPVHLMRYEDMLEKPTETFRSAVTFLGLPDDEERLALAIRFSSFEGLRRQEETKGFRERPAVAEAFFRKGQAGEWRMELSADQVARIIQHHGAVMERLGYL